MGDVHTVPMIEHAFPHRYVYHIFFSGKLEATTGETCHSCFLSRYFSGVSISHLDFPWRSYSNADQIQIYSTNITWQDDNSKSMGAIDWTSCYIAKDVYISEWYKVDRWAAQKIVSLGNKANLVCFSKRKYGRIKQIKDISAKIDGTRNYFKGKAFT